MTATFIDPDGSISLELDLMDVAANLGKHGPKYDTSTTSLGRVLAHSNAHATDIRAGKRGGYLPTYMARAAAHLPRHSGYYFTDRGVRYFGGEKDPHWEDENDLIDTKVTVWLYLAVIPEHLEFERLQLGETATA